MRKLHIWVVMLISYSASAQSIYKSASNVTSFFAGTSIEDIDATNDKSVSFLNIQTGEISISIPNKEFHFKKSLMEEHFNENYMESEKYPKTIFKGKIDHVEKYNFKSSEPFHVTVTGSLTVHGITKERTLEVTIHQKDNKLIGETKFKVALADHNIDRPKILWEKLAEDVDVTATFTYELYQK